MARLFSSAPEVSRFLLPPDTGLLAALTKHSAPPVLYPIGRARIQYWFLWGIWLAGLLLMLLWFLSTRRIDWRLGLGCASVLISGGMLLQGWRNAIIGQLSWDGSCWHWESMQAQTFNGQNQLSVVADLDRIMVIVQDNGEGRRLWFCAERNTFPDRWMDFRRAVYSTRKASPWPAQVDHVAG